MDFISEYKKYKKEIKCDFRKNYEVTEFFPGNSAFILFINNKSNSKEKYVLKLFPHPKRRIENELSSFNTFDLEIKFNEFFTKKYLLKQKTPHIIGMFDHIKCSNLPKFIKKLNACINLVDQLNNNYVESYPSYCELIKQIESGIIDKSYDMMILEYGGVDIYKYLSMMANFLNITSHEVHDTQPFDVEALIHKFVNILDRILFQFIFTIAVIKKTHPTFTHGDLYPRNVVIQNIESYQDNEYVAYHFNNEIFYMPCNGSHLKIFDFEHSRLSGISNIASDVTKYLLLDEFDDFTDIYNFIVNLRTKINEIMISRPYWIKLYDRINDFIDINFVDQSIEAIKYFSEFMGKNNLNAVRSTVKPAAEYLNSDIFDNFKKKPKNAVIIKHYNKQT